MSRHLFFAFLLAALACSLAACSSKRTAPVIPDAPILIGVVPFTQPAATNELMAGYISGDVQKIDAQVFTQLDNDFSDLLASMTTRQYMGLERARQCIQSRPKSANSSAFDYWLAIGRCMDVDLLLVPQIHVWQERRGSDMGSDYPAAVSMDSFLLDVKNRVMLQRSRYDEKQRALLENLMDVGKFIERKGRWVDAGTLGKEGMFKAIKDFGL